LNLRSSATATAWNPPWRAGAVSTVARQTARFKARRPIQLPRPSRARGGSAAPLTRRCVDMSRCQAEACRRRDPPPNRIDIVGFSLGLSRLPTSQPTSPASLGPDLPPDRRSGCLFPRPDCLTGGTVFRSACASRLSIDLDRHRRPLHGPKPDRRSPYKHSVSCFRSATAAAPAAFRQPRPYAARSAGENH
jgi:hypothetical protein